MWPGSPKMLPTTDLDKININLRSNKNSRKNPVLHWFPKIINTTHENFKLLNVVINYDDFKIKLLKKCFIVSILQIY
jgi:hypothetical protein